MRTTIALTATALALLATGPVSAETTADPVQNSANGHYYEVVTANVTWAQAKAAAASRTYLGIAGHLATVTSESENSFLVTTFGTALFDAWLGGYQDAGVSPADAGWQWVTGETWDYTAWKTGEPNDGWGAASEQALRYYWSSGSWNDARADRTGVYVVEYEVPQTITDAPIDVQPGSDVNPINMGSGGVTPVAILTEGTFDATQVLASSVRMGPDDLAPVDSELKDVDEDGDTDLLLRFTTADLGLAASDTSVTVSGELTNGIDFTGSDSVRVKEANTSASSNASSNGKGKKDK